MMLKLNTVEAFDGPAVPSITAAYTRKGLDVEALRNRHRQTNVDCWVAAVFAIEHLTTAIIGRDE